MSFKIDEALRNLNGSQNHREYNRLIRYQIKIRDKTVSFKIIKKKLKLINSFFISFLFLKCAHHLKLSPLN